MSRRGRRPRVNPAKRKGTSWETEVVRYLSSHGFPNVYRQVPMGPKDEGDIGGVPHFALEAKNVKTITLSEFVKQANHEAGNKGVPWGVSVIKKRRANVADGYVVMDLATFAEVAWAAGAWTGLMDLLEVSDEDE